MMTTLTLLLLLIASLWTDYKISEINKRIEAIEEKQKPKPRKKKSTCKPFSPEVLAQSCSNALEPIRYEKSEALRLAQELEKEGWLNITPKYPSECSFPFGENYSSILLTKSDFAYDESFIDYVKENGYSFVNYSEISGKFISELTIHIK